MILLTLEQKILLTLNENFVHLWYHRQKKYERITRLSDIEHKRASLEIPSLFQLLPVDFLDSSI